MLKPFHLCYYFSSSIHLKMWKNLHKFSCPANKSHRQDVQLCASTDISLLLYCTYKIKTFLLKNEKHWLEKRHSLLFLPRQKKKKAQEKSDLKAMQNERKHQTHACMRKSCQMHYCIKDSEDINFKNLFVWLKLAFNKRTM